MPRNGVFGKSVLPCLLALGALLAVSGWSVTAQAAPPHGVRGQVAALKGDMLTISTANGQKVAVELSKKTGITAVIPAKLSMVKTGTYIGTAALPQPNGSLLAMEIQVFPNSMRGVGEGERPWDLRPHSTMTNATVAHVSGVHGRTLELTYSGKQVKVVVPAKAPVITYQPGSRALLHRGASVLAIAAPGADGKLVALRVAVGKNGTKVPM